MRKELDNLFGWLTFLLALLGVGGMIIYSSGYGNKVLPLVSLLILGLILLFSTISLLIEKKFLITWANVYWYLLFIKGNREDLIFNFITKEEHPVCYYAELSGRIIGTVMFILLSLCFL